MINFSTLNGLTIPEGVVTQITDASGRVLWAVSGESISDTVVLEVEKTISDTYAGETTYTGEQFILLDIYPKTNGTVKVTYGGLTKTVTDTSGVVEPNAQQVYFGTFNGVSDSVTTPASGTLKIEGDYRGFGCGKYSSGKFSAPVCNCIIVVTDLGNIEVIPENAFGNAYGGCPIEKIKITSRIKSIGVGAFDSCSRLTNIIVDKNNDYYSSQGGILFNKEKTLLHSAPVVSGHFTIPDGVIDIAKSACNQRQLTSLTIPNSVASIGQSAFARNNLTSVIVLATTPPLSGSDIFGAVKDSNGVIVWTAPIIVPKGCADAYKAADGWSTYADYIVEAS
jgi:hypothetical protein